MSGDDPPLPLGLLDHDHGDLPNAASGAGGGSRRKMKPLLPRAEVDKFAGALIARKGPHAKENVNDVDQNELIKKYDLIDVSMLVGDRFMPSHAYTFFFDETTGQMTEVQDGLQVTRYAVLRNEKFIVPSEDFGAFLQFLLESENHRFFSAQDSKPKKVILASKKPLLLSLIIFGIFGMVTVLTKKRVELSTVLWRFANMTLEVGRE